MTKPNLHFQRFEFKYYLPKNKADKLIPALLNYMEWDPFVLATGRDFYQVNSLYFDSSDFGCFWDKESGISNRKKLRFRFYNQRKEDTPIFLEIKRKRDALTIKDRINLDFDDCTNGNLDNNLKKLLRARPDDKFLRELIWFKGRNSLKPKLFVTYNRKALVSKRDKRFRITFDYNIQTQLCDSITSECTRLKNVFPDGVVLELKYNNVLPQWFHRIIQKYQLQRLAYSKYCNSLRQVIPQFDDNNYSVE